MEKSVTCEQDGCHCSEAVGFPDDFPAAQVGKALLGVLEREGWRKIDGKWSCPLCNRTGRFYASAKEHLGKNPEVGKRLRRRRGL